MDLLAFAKHVAERVEAEASRTKVPVVICVIDLTATQFSSTG